MLFRSYAVEPAKLSAAADAAISAAIRGGDPVYLPSICLVELRFLVEHRKFPEAVFSAITALLSGSGAPFRTMPLTEEIAVSVGRIPRDLVPNLQDRVIAATALHLGLPLVTCDRKIRSTAVATVW